MKRDNWIAFIPFYLLTMILFIGIAKGGSHMVSALARKEPVVRTECIVIDAGHGGEDGGATSCTGVPESKLNLSISLRVESLLQLLGYDTVMIRKTDTSVYTSGETLAAKKVSDLKERVRIVNAKPKGILISIHQNTYPDARYSGGQVFYASAPGSREFAEILQQRMREILNPGSRRTMKKARGIYLMDHIRRPGVLLECGFLSNPEEEARLRDPAYQKKLSIVIASSLGSYLCA